MTHLAISAFLDTQERAALVELCRLDLRDPSAQIRFLIREAALRRGILSEDPSLQRLVTKESNGEAFQGAAVALHSHRS